MTEACCESFLDGSWACQDLEPCECLLLPRGAPMGPGTTCALMCPDHLAIPCERCGTVACCGLDGTCQDRNQGRCLADGGDSAGPGTSCNDFGDGNFTCFDGLTPCCRADGTCFRASGPSDCIGQGGLPAGGSHLGCESIDCFGLIGITEACCMMSGHCADETFLGCCSEGGIPQGVGSTCAVQGDNCAPFDPPGCRQAEPDRRARHPVTDEPYLRTTGDLCALALFLPWILELGRGVQLVTTHPVRITALSSMRYLDGVEPCHLHTAEFVETGGRWHGRLCGQRVHGHAQEAYQSLAGVVFIESEEFNGHAFVGSYEPPPWQEAHFHSFQERCGGVKR